MRFWRQEPQRVIFMFGDLPAGLALSLVSKGVASAIKWVAQLDGLTQYWQLSEPIVIPENVDFRLTQTFSGVNDSFEGLLDSTDGSFWLRLMPTSQSNNIQAFLGAAYTSEIPHSTINLRDGNYHTLTFARVSGVIHVIYDGVTSIANTNNSAFNIHRMARFSTAEFEGVYKEFEVEIDGVITNQIPLTNKAQGATQLATVGNINAFMPNYTEAVWRKP